MAKKSFESQDVDITSWDHTAQMIWGMLKEAYNVKHITWSDLVEMRIEQLRSLNLSDEWSEATQEEIIQCISDSQAGLLFGILYHAGNIPPWVEAVARDQLYNVDEETALKVPETYSAPGNFRGKKRGAKR